MKCYALLGSSGPDATSQPHAGTRLIDDDSVLTRAAGAPAMTVAYGPEVEQVADIRLGKRGGQPRPLLVLIHGGFWRPAYDRAHLGPMSDALASAGWTVATIEYRRVPGRPDLTLEDVKRAVQALPELVVENNRKMILIGHSAGGHLALWAGAMRDSPSVVGILALAPAADLQLAQQWNLGDGAVLAFLGVAAQARRDVDPKALPSPRIPVRILHGELDDTVPVEVSQSYVATHPAAHLARLPHTGHFAVIDPLSPVWTTVVAELASLAQQVASVQ